MDRSKIGTTLAKRVQGSDLRILYADPIRKPEPERALLLEYASLATLLTHADVIVIAVPLSKETRSLIGTAELRSMKRMLSARPTCAARFLER